MLRVISSLVTNDVPLEHLCCSGVICDVTHDVTLEHERCRDVLPLWRLVPFVAYSLQEKGYLGDT